MHSPSQGGIEGVVTERRRVRCGVLLVVLAALLAGCERDDTSGQGPVRLERLERVEDVAFRNLGKRAESELPPGP
ncbi:MAG: hypothetical protein KatS3mg076_1303 [Candidatus Binatia bacterium]|nr:MAG: hypothetical protein KatS3mg076_1303 [Candidatus Binatia bacterium]